MAGLSRSEFWRGLAKSTRWCVLFLSLQAGVAAASATVEATNQVAGPHPHPERLRWWAEGRFGLFIHWGPVSLKETEISWSRANSNPKRPNKGEIPVEVYDNLYRQFNPTNFNAREWVRLAKAAGTKYMVLTAKHCDGFLLWPSQASDYNIANTPFQRDICAELARAARKQDMRIGWYFSPMDWRDADFRTGRKVEVHQTPQGIEIALAADGLDALDPIIASELDRSALSLPAVEVTAAASLTTNAKATASNVYHGLAEYGPDQAVDGRDDTRWATDEGTTSARLEVDLGKPATVSRSVIRQAFPELRRIHKFAVEYLQDSQWKACCQGEDPGSKLRLKFEPVTAQRVRWNLLDATGGPTIWEFQLLP